MKENLKKLPLGLAESILESISDGVFTVNLNWEITYFNNAAEKITKISRDEVIGRFCAEVFKSNMCEGNCPLKKTIKDKRPIIGQAGFIINALGEKVPISVSTAVLTDDKGNIIGGAETFRDLSEIERLRLELSSKYRVGNLVSRSLKMQKIFEILPTISNSPSTVLILGETGTGKELIARTIHELSPRKNGPFVAINCSALPETLLEAEFFGYKKGAFTGATQNRKGKLEAANKGTLFLDEIGDMPISIQAKLLRVIQERSFEPIGSNKSVSVDIRIICATNKDLDKLVEKEQFRKDLYYRINVIKLELPPLRERKEDIPVLVDNFISHFNKLLGKNIKGISPEALSLLMTYNWPGNIRELENVIERASILCFGDIIHVEHLPEEIFSPSAPLCDNIKQTKSLMEKQLIISALKQNNFDPKRTASSLGIHKTTLYRKLKKYNIQLAKRSS
ncbi:sigma 54-interacting transcriptional regulator OrpR [Desulfothermus okinawensis JCM 13304]